MPVYATQLRGGAYSTRWSSLRLDTVPHFFLHEAILGLPSASILWNAQLLFLP